MDFTCGGATGSREYDRAHVKSQGMSFGAADSDLLHWSDGNVCCSAVDLLGMGNGMRFNFLTAVRRGCALANLV